MSGIIWGGLVPHPPLIIPAIGRDDIHKVHETSLSMTALARKIKAMEADTIVMITPHGPVFYDGIPIWDLAEIEGTFARFGYPQVRFQTSMDQDLIQMIQKESGKIGVETIGLDPETIRRTGVTPEMDHGVMVPLYFLQKENVHVPLVIISMGMISESKLYLLGKAIQQAADASGKKVAVLASGDLSHCLMEGAPAEYNPAGKKFDESLKNYLENGQFDEVLKMDPQMVSEAAECGYKPVLILLGALDALIVAPEILSYEGPFGVGYMTAGFHVKGKKPTAPDNSSCSVANHQGKTNDHSFGQWARKCLDTYVKQKVKHPIPEFLAVEMKQRAGVFVSIKKNGLLRGCIGTVFPVHDNIATEIRDNAISAGTKDPRFYPVTEAELSNLVYSVDVLSGPEPVTDPATLDSQMFGVIVRQGNRVGVLLPDLEGIDSYEEQIRIACQKAGIQPGSNYSLERFRVTRYE